MTSHTAFSELGAFAVYFLYGSFFEWFFHRYLFHSPKPIWRTFNAHTLVHHQIYKSDETYHTHDEHPKKVTMDWWALLAMVGFHLPFFWLIQRLTGIPSLWGGVAAVAVYFGLYESLHWAMHVPRASRFLSRFAAYRFLEEHHRLHHKYMLSNLNVILPIADLAFGTLRVDGGRKVQPLWHRAKRAAAANEAASSHPSAALPPPKSAAPVLAKKSTVVE